jgi:hypothetical protein
MGGLRSAPFAKLRSVITVYLSHDDGSRHVVARLPAFSPFQEIVSIRRVIFGVASIVVVSVAANIALAHHPSQPPRGGLWMFSQHLDANHDGQVSMDEVLRRGSLEYCDPRSTRSDFRVRLID